MYGSIFFGDMIELIFVIQCKICIVLWTVWCCESFDLPVTSEMIYFIYIFKHIDFLNSEGFVDLLNMAVTFAYFVAT